VARDHDHLNAALGLIDSPTGAFTEEKAASIARAVLADSEAEYVLASLIDLDEGPDRIDFGGTLWTAVANGHEVIVRRSRILGGREWVRLGAVEMGLDCLRRFLQGLPVVERIDFEKT